MPIIQCQAISQHFRRGKPDDYGYARIVCSDADSFYKVQQIIRCLQEWDNNMGFVKAAIARTGAGSDTSERFLYSN